MRKFLCVSLLLVGISFSAVADEGMWLMPYLEKMNIKDMNAKGFKLSAKDIYNLNGDALKDAIVIFGGGCTGEVISDKGLVLTNHHCGYGAIQSHSTVQNDFLKNGFWATSFAEEIPSPTIAVTFVRGIEDVTNQVLVGVTDKMNEDQRAKKIQKNIENITAGYGNLKPGSSVVIRDFFGGNQYLMFRFEKFNDVRMVGAPPSSIGKFGGETDNWMWPRHTGDFSLFRIYSAPDGSPAEYSRDNVPYNAPKHLKISLDGYKEGDFAMIIGFPGSTKRYMSSHEIDYTLAVDNPVRIFVRGERQAILTEDMRASDKVRIQYASKYASSSNYWKNSIGMSRGLVKLDVKAKKQELEERFSKWLQEDKKRVEKYGDPIAMKKEAVSGRAEYQKAQQYLTEALTRSVEILSMAAKGEKLVDSTGNLNPSELGKLKQDLPKIYKDYNEPTDRKVAQRMFRITIDSLDAWNSPKIYKEIENEFCSDYTTFVNSLYDNSIFATQEKLEAFLEHPSAEQLLNDPAYKFQLSLQEKKSELAAKIVQYDQQFNRAHRNFIAGLMEMDKNKNFYPDANFTMRLTYGNILPYSPADAVMYELYTTLSGVIAKEDPTNPVEFTVPAKLKELYKAKDFGRYAYKGDVPVAFLSNTDITGGNSGSPVLNAKGELIGLAFDGNWEAMSGDIAFEPELQRTISVDIRYVLFIIDKFADAQRLIDEMTIVKK